MKDLFKSKTFYTGLGSIIAGIGLIVTSGDVVNGGQYIIGGLAAIFLRHSVADAKAVIDARKD
jgi:hypothetical protein